MIGRFIIIAAAAFLGVLVVLTSMTTVRPVPVNPNMPVFKRTDTRESEFPKAGLPTMSEARRRDRAAQLVGEPLEYLQSGRLHHPTSIKQRGIEALEQMMDECFLLTDETLLAQHLEAIADAEMDPSEVGHPLDHVTKSQLRSCDNIAKVYDETHS